MMSVREIMSTEIVSVEPATTVAEAATIMGARHVGSALVLAAPDDELPIGIFTERDALRALASDFDAARSPVEHWMTRSPVTIDSDADIREARDMMLESGFRHLPVLTDGRLAGMVSIRDLSRADRGRDVHPR